MAESAWAFTEEDAADFGFAVDEQVLGGGAYGAVYGATLHGRPVAAKTLHALREPELYGLVGPGSDPGAREAVLAGFSSEADVLASVDHPQILKFWGVCYARPGADGVRLPKWIVTERQPHSLDAFIRLPRVGPLLGPSDVLCLSLDMAEGLQFLHSKGILHRDLKPKSVLVGPSGAKLADLGTAKMIGIAAATAQHTVGPGTAIYHPPEALAGEYR